MHQTVENAVTNAMLNPLMKNNEKYMSYLYIANLGQTPHYYSSVDQVRFDRILDLTSEEMDSDPA